MFKKIFLIMLCVIIMIPVMTSCSSADTVRIGNLTVDKNAESISLLNSGITNLTKLKKLTNLKKLDMAGSQIESLEGIENLTLLEEIILDGSAVRKIDELATLNSLKSVSMRQTEISDISPLAGSGVENLTISDNENLNDISATGKMKNLKKLEIANSPGILDFSVIAGAEKLEALKISDSGLFNIDFLKELPLLTSLELKAKGIRNPEPLKKIKNLKSFSFTGSDIFSDLKIIKELKGLEELRLNECQVTDISGISVLENLKIVDLSFNSIENTEPLGNLTEIEELNLSSNTEIKDISSLGKLTELRVLHLEGCAVEDISVAENFKKLEELYINNNKVKSFQAIKNLTTLEKFFADNCGVSDVSPLAKLENLTHLQLVNNSIEDISPLKGKTQLMQLGLGNNNFKDVSVLADMTKLVNLDISYNKNIKDLHFAEKMTNLSFLNADNTSVTEEAVAHMRNHLPSCTISCEV